jgi:hypothetical protein
VKYFVAYVKRTIIRLIAITFAGTAVLAVAGYGAYITGWLGGSFVNLVYFGMLSSRLAGSRKMPAAQAQAFIRGGLILRLVMIVLTLIIVVQFPQIKLFTFVAGLMMYRVLIFGETFIRALRHNE